MLTVYSRPGCTFCTMTIELLLSRQDKFVVVTCEDCAELKNVLSNKHGIRLEKVTFPQILKHNTLIGGYTDLGKYIEDENNVFKIDNDCF